MYSDNAVQEIKSSLYSPHYAQACNEWRGPSPRLSAWATQLRTNVATVASRWRHCADLIGPRIEPQTSRTDSVCFACLTSQSSWQILQQIQRKNAMILEGFVQLQGRLHSHKLKLNHRACVRFLGQKIAA